jgi:hypothetical protein
MRYLLPIVPMLSALVAWMLISLANGETKSLRHLAMGALAGYLVAILVFVIFPDRMTQLNQTLSSYALFAIAAVSLIAGFHMNSRTQRSALLAAGIGLGLAHFYATSDILASQMRRSAFADLSAKAAEISEKAIFYGSPQAFGGAIKDPDYLVALPATGGGNVDVNLLRHACQEGFRVFLGDTYVPYVEDFGFSIQSPKETDLPSYSEMNCG